MGKADKILNKYKCRYCGYEFEQLVGSIGDEKHNKVSSQVKCPGCGNFLKTYPKY